MVGIALLVVYLGSYIALSRKGFAEARSNGMSGFYFFTPENTHRWRQMNYACVALYYPLIAIEDWLGTGMPPGCEPMWGLSSR
jgi:hypothetical protein